MHTIATPIIQTVLNSDYANDGDQLATVCIVTLQDRISAMNIQSLTKVRGKAINKKQREAATDLLADIVFYLIILAHVNDMDMAVFDAEALGEFADEFHPDYLADTILCGTHLMSTVCEIMEDMFDTEGLDEEAHPETATLEDSPKTTAELVAAITGEDPEPNLEESTSMEQLFATAFGCTMILAHAYDTDYEIIMHNASIIEEI